MVSMTITFLEISDAVEQWLICGHLQYHNEEHSCCSICLGVCTTWFILTSLEPYNKNCKFTVWLEEDEFLVNNTIDVLKNQHWFNVTESLAHFLTAVILMTSIVTIAALSQSYNHFFHLRFDISVFCWLVMLFSAGSTQILQ